MQAGPAGQAGSIGWGTDWVVMKKDILLKNTARLFGVLVIGLTLGACASAPSEPEARAEYEAQNDPLEPMNRYFFEVNRGLDQLLLRPAAEIYRGAVPDMVQQMVHNFLLNLNEPIVFTNSLLQGDPDNAGKSFGRFAANTFIGVGGLFDVAGIDRQEEDFGQTLGVWGLGEGPYLVLPVIGPRPPRDLAGMVADTYIDPWNYLARRNDIDFPEQTVRFIAEGVDARSRNIEAIDEIERSSIDFYATVRSLYRQRRAALISNGDVTPEMELEPVSFEFEDDRSMENKTAAVAE